MFRSRKPEARRFRKWVTSEVLPGLRKTGFYSFDDSRRAALERVSEGTKRTVIKELTALARHNKDRAPTLEADIVNMLLLLAPGSGNEHLEPELTRLFWRAFDQLEAKGVKVNHSSNPSQIAVNLPDFFEMAAQEGFFPNSRAELVKLLPYSRRRLLHGNKNLHSALLKKSVKCWVFLRTSLENSERKVKGVLHA